MKDPIRQSRVLGSLWGSLVGDALGVPVEFRSRAEVQREPVKAMRAFGTHSQPAGTWSDDSSLLLCSAESLAECGSLDTHDMAERFRRWAQENHWTPHGRVFDIGIATSKAISRFASGTPAERAGGDTEGSNGNGSLMRILPVALWHARRSDADLLDAVGRASAITHRHLRSQMACGFFALFVKRVLEGAAPTAAFDSALLGFQDAYASEPFASERVHFAQLESGGLAALPEAAIGSDGYVINTLIASLWCLLTSGSFDETVLKAVNLGSDTDTTGCVAGALAGLCFGTEAIPAAWLELLARRADVELLLHAFRQKLEPATQR